MKTLRLIKLTLAAFVLGVSSVSCSQDDTSINEETGEGSHKGHTFVDLGLTVKWATCNVGAENPWEYGNYYAWGETKPKTYYSLDTYFRSIDQEACKFDILIGPDICGTKYDAARVNWGGKWRMPSNGEILDLINNCKWNRTTMNGVRGYEIIGKNGNSIFLPFAGEYDDEYEGHELYYDGEYPCYWSGTADDECEVYAYCIYDKEEDEIISVEEGLPIRPVY